MRLKLREVYNLPSHTVSVSGTEFQARSSASRAASPPQSPCSSVFTYWRSVTFEGIWVTWSTLTHSQRVSGEESFLEHTASLKYIHLLSDQKRQGFPLCYHTCFCKPTHIKRARNITSIILAKINLKEIRNHQKKRCKWQPSNRNGAYKPCQMQTSDLHKYPSSAWKPGSAARAREWFALALCTASMMVFIYFSLYVVSPQILLDGDNVHAHASLTGLELRLLVSLHVITTKSVTESKLTNKSMSSEENKW